MIFVNLRDIFFNNPLKMHYFVSFSKPVKHPLARFSYMSPCKKGGKRFGRMFWPKLPLEYEVLVPSRVCRAYAVGALPSLFSAQNKTETWNDFFFLR